MGMRKFNTEINDSVTGLSTRQQFLGSEGLQKQNKIFGYLKQCEILCNRWFPPLTSIICRNINSKMSL